MAIGTLTVTAQHHVGPQTTIYMDQISLVGDSSYPTGGMTGVQAALRAKTGDQRTILDVRSVGLNGGYSLAWDLANGKLLALNSGGGVAKDLPTEIDNATNLSGVTFLLLVTSK